MHAKLPWWLVFAVKSMGYHNSANDCMPGDSLPLGLEESPADLAYAVADRVACAAANEGCGAVPAAPWVAHVVHAPGEWGGTGALHCLTAAAPCHTQGYFRKAEEGQAAGSQHPGEENQSGDWTDENRGP